MSRFFSVLTSAIPSADRRAMVTRYPAVVRRQNSAAQTANSYRQTVNSARQSGTVPADVMQALGRAERNLISSNVMLNSMRAQLVRASEEAIRRGKLDPRQGLQGIGIVATLVIVAAVAVVLIEFLDLSWYLNYKRSQDLIAKSEEDIIFVRKWRREWLANPQSVPTPPVTFPADPSMGPRPVGVAAAIGPAAMLAVGFAAMLAFGRRR